MAEKTVAERSLELHEKYRGKLEIKSRVPVKTKEDLSLAYTPGVAQPCLEIQKDIDKSYVYTNRWNTCLVVTDGTAVLGLGDIGPEAGMPVMEGKCVLFKEFGNVDAVSYTHLGGAYGWKAAGCARIQGGAPAEDFLQASRPEFLQDQPVLCIFWYSASRSGRENALKGSSRRVFSG